MEDCPTLEWKVAHAKLTSYFTVHLKAAKQFILCAIWVHIALYTFLSCSTISLQHLPITKKETSGKKSVGQISVRINKFHCF